MKKIIGAFLVVFMLCSCKKTADLEVLSDISVDGYKSMPPVEDVSDVVFD